MPIKYLPNKLDTKKVVFCFLLGLVLLVILLLITPEYFEPNGIRDKFFSSLENFGKNLSTAASEKGSVTDWLVKAFKEYDTYLKENIPLLGVFLAVMAFIALCWPILQFIGRDILRISDDDLKPLKWDINTEIVNKLAEGKLLRIGLEALLAQPKKKAKKGPEQIALKDETGQDKPIEFKSKFSYLFLIERQAPQDHFSRFWESITSRFKDAGVATTTFFFKDDPRVCLNDEHPDGLTLQELKDAFDEVVLVVIGPTRALVDSDGNLNQWTEAFKEWKDPLFLTTNQYHSWGKDETSAKEIFLVLPATISSIQYLTLYSEDLDKIDIEEEEHQIDYANTSFNESNLDQHFSKTVTNWIQSCALYPDLQHDLSLEIGNEIFQKNDSQLTESIILSVFQLPWFRQGVIPEPIKSNLAQQLRASAPNVEQIVRKFLGLKLPGFKPPASSFASLFKGEFESFNEWLTISKKDKEARKKVRKNLNRIYNESPVEPDPIYNKIEGPHNQLSKHIPSEQARSFVFNKGFSGLGFSEKFRNILRSILAGLILLAVYLLIILLSRPEGGIASQFPDCIVQTQVIDVPNTELYTINVSNSENRNRLIYLNGVEPCYPVKFELLGNYERKGENQDSIQPTIFTINESGTLRFYLKDTVRIRAWQPFEITDIDCPGDTIPYYFIDTLKRVKIDSTDCSECPRCPPECCDDNDNGNGNGNGNEYPGLQISALCSDNLNEAVKIKGLTMIVNNTESYRYFPNNSTYNIQGLFSVGDTLKFKPIGNERITNDERYVVRKGLNQIALHLQDTSYQRQKKTTLIGEIRPYCEDLQSLIKNVRGDTMLVVEYKLDEIIEPVRTNKGTFCKEVDQLDFCKSQLIISTKWKGKTLSRTYKIRDFPISNGEVKFSTIQMDLCGQSQD